MKNKILASITALCAALVLVGGFSVTAYAQTPTEETNDSGVIVETEPQPLTPEGNMTLVDDIDGDAAEDKQFIVVKSKGGNYFYIIVDRAAEGENSVHFLNQVDESDLIAELQKAQEQAQDAPREKAAMPEYIYKIEANPRTTGDNDRFFLQAYLPQENGRAKIGDVLYIGSLAKCRELMGGLNAGELTQGEVKELYGDCLALGKRSACGQEHRAGKHCSEDLFEGTHGSSSS